MHLSRHEKSADRRKRIIKKEEGANLVFKPLSSCSVSWCYSLRA